MSIAGSQRSVSLSTIRGSRAYQLVSAWTSRNESPGPACRQHTISGRPVYDDGSGPSTSTRTCSTHCVAANRVRRKSRTTS
jgi:hypothetical protein